jgi:hypothetical protein
MDFRYNYREAQKASERSENPETTKDTRGEGEARAKRARSASEVSAKRERTIGEAINKIPKEIKSKYNIKKLEEKKGEADI